MKTTFFFLLTMLSASTLTLAQKQQCTIVSVSLNTTSSILDQLDAYNPILGAEQTNFNYSWNWFRDSLKHHLVNYAQVNWEEKYDYPMDDLYALSGILSYDGDFPNPLMPNKAVKKVAKTDFEGDWFISLNLNLKVQEDEIGSTQLLERIKPRVELNIKIFDEKGKKKYQSRSTKIYSDFISAESLGLKEFDKMNTTHLSLLCNEIASLIDKATKTAIGYLKLKF